MRKRCPGCKQEKDELEFFKDKATKSGLSSYCKLCTKDRDRRRDPVNLLKHAARQKALIRRRKEAGLCYYCGIRPPDSGYQSCSHCRGLNKTYTENSRAKQAPYH